MITARFISARNEKKLQEQLLQLTTSKDKGYQIINIYQRNDGMIVAWYYMTINEALNEEMKELRNEQANKLN